MYRYADLEAVLVRLHSVPAAHRKAFSARLKYFQRIGILKQSPGKGARIEYTFSDIWIFALCMELAQCGIDPTRIAMMASWLALIVEPALSEGKRPKEDLIFAARPIFLSREGVEDQEKSGTTGQGFMPIVDPYDPDQSFVFKASELSKLNPARALHINLTDLRARIEEALTAASAEAEA